MEVQEVKEPLPDLSLSRFHLINREQVEMGQPAVYEMIVQNIGEEPAEEISWQVFNTRTNEILAESGAFPIARMEAGHEMILYPRFSLPCDTIRGVVDPDDMIIEADEENNAREDFPEGFVCDGNEGYKSKAKKKIVPEASKIPNDEDGGKRRTDTKKNVEKENLKKENVKKVTKILFTRIKEKSPQKKNPAPPNRQINLKRYSKTSKFSLLNSSLLNSRVFYEDQK